MDDIVIQSNNIYYKKNGKINIKSKKKDNTTFLFLIGTVILSVASFFVLDVDWLKLISRFLEIGVVFSKLIMFNFSNTDLIFTSFLETVSITVLSTFYSLLLGLFFGMLASENIFKVKYLPTFIKSFFTFLRAIPTPVWVLLMLVCLGFGPSAGIVGLSVHTIAFFTRAFSQSFEDISPDIIEALEVTGATRFQIFVAAVLPSALSQMIAWVGVRFEINFAECAILGMVGAGGIGYVVSSSLQNYDYGTAGFAICIVFIFAICVERIFIVIKKKMK